MSDSLYPSLTKEHKDHLENALCSFSVDLPKSLKPQIDEIVSEFLESKKELSKNWQDSVLNCIDFHYFDERLKIIEANTNASGYMISHLLNLSEDEILHFEDRLFSSFCKVFESDTPSPLYIVDSNPEEEKMYPEFLMFKDFFKRKGVEEIHILDTQVLEDKLKNNDETREIFVYNRDTDFYLEGYPHLKKAWEDKKAHLSTHPVSYHNMAFKDAPIISPENSQKFKALDEAVLKTHPFSEDLWERRKKLFFKPKESFGSKGVYAGKSLSKKKFQTLDENYMAQELHPAGKIEHSEETWKFDVRAYFSEGEVQKILARVYQGQVTNFSKSGGGFALIDWV